MDTTPRPDDEHLARVALRAGIPVPTPTPAPQHHQVLLGGMRFHYLEWGGAESPTIVWLHGGNQTAHTWDVICMALSARYRCICLDQRGHGDSEWSYGHFYRPEDYLADTRALVRHLGLDHFALVGMSMGCMNALNFAARHADSLAGLVAVDAGPYIDAEGGAHIVDFVQSNAQLPELESYVDAALRFNPRRDPALLRGSLRRSVRPNVDGTWSWKADVRRAFPLEATIGWLADLAVLLPRITCPTLVVHGQQSRVLSDANARRFTSELPNARLVTVPDAGHAVQGDNPAGLLRVLEPFMAEVLLQP